ncbi:MAG: sigma-70 family RNA polymerase sigma factor [Gemmatimonadaceae bacterium]
MGESELLARLREGDAEAYASIFREHYSWLVLSANRLLGERALAEEVAQDVMLELWRRRAALTLTGPLRAYLHQSTRNRALNHLRHVRTVRLSEPFIRPPTRAPHADAGAVSHELAAAARDAVSQLSAPQREVFEMSRKDGLTYPEIASALSISVKTVEARMGRALRHLRERLAPWLPPGGGW